MKICDEHGEGEVCYNENVCPACEIQKGLSKEVCILSETIEDLEAKTDELETEKTLFESYIQELLSKIDELESRL